MILFYATDTVRRLRWKAASWHRRPATAAAAAARASETGGYSVAYSVPGGRIVAEFRDGRQVFPAPGEEEQ